MKGVAVALSVLLITVASACATGLPAPADPAARFYGVWEKYGEGCASSQRGWEGPYFEIGPGSYVPPGGGLCENLEMRVDGDVLTITGRCTHEESEFGDERIVLRLAAPYLEDASGQKFERCSP